MSRLHQLPDVDVGNREMRLRAELDVREVEAIVLTSPSNIRWLTGFAGSNATVVVRGEHITLFTDSRYADRAPLELERVASSAVVEIARATLGDEVRRAVDSCLGVALEADHVSWARQQEIATRWLPDQQLIATIGIVDQLRAIKDAPEVARIERAAAIVDEALSSVAGRLTEAPTERGFAQALEAAIRAGGADDIGFDTIVASGPNGAVPHHQPGSRVVQRGDLVIVDVGGKVDGYRSDMTRTFCVGPMSPSQRRQYDTVVTAQQAGVDAMVAGAATASVDAAARGIVTDAGWGDAFTHGTGHGIGLDIHELPRVAEGVADVYAIGTVATVEPGVYLRGEGGVRVEDTCVVTAAGARRLTRFPKDPEL